MLESVFMHYTNSNFGVCITNVENLFIIDAIAAYCRLVELRDFNKVVCSAEILYKVIHNYIKGTNCKCELTDNNYKACLICEIQSDTFKYIKGSDWFANPRTLVFLSDIYEINDSQPKDLQFDEAYLKSQFNSYLFRF